MSRWKKEMRYSQPSDWVFPSGRLEGKQPRVANMLVEDYLRPVAMKAGILSSYRNDEGNWLRTIHGEKSLVQERVRAGLKHAKSKGKTSRTSPKVS
jgi:hypothetical protein